LLNFLFLYTQQSALLKYLQLLEKIGNFRFSKYDVSSALFWQTCRQFFTLCLMAVVKVVTAPALRWDSNEGICEKAAANPRGESEMDRALTAPHQLLLHQ
jgi:hypothetical protein